MNPDPTMKRFFQLTESTLVEHLRIDEVLIRLWSNDIISLKEKDRIGNLQTGDNDKVMELIQVLCTKNPDHLDTIIKAIEDCTECQWDWQRQWHWEQLHAQLISNSPTERAIPVNSPSSVNIISSSATLIRKSEVDPTRNVRPDSWVISLARKPDSAHHEHAFIIVEGIQNGNAVIWFIDFVSKSGYGAGTHPGKIRIFSSHKPMDDYLSLPYHDKLLFSCNRQMMDVAPRETLLFTAWDVSIENALLLIQSAETKKEKGDLPKFVITGRDSVFAYSSGKTKSEEPGHNCFTWAKSLLLELGEVKGSGNLIYTDIREWVKCATSHVLEDKRPIAVAKQRYQTLAIVAIVVAVGSFLYNNNKLN